MRKIMIGILVIMFLFVAGCAVEDGAMEDKTMKDGEAMEDKAAEPVTVNTATTPAKAEGDAMEGKDGEAMEKAPVAVAEGEVSLTRSTFDPDTLTVTKGATITFVMIDGPHLLADNGQRFTGRMNAGERADLTFDEVGVHKIFDALLKGVIMVTVTE